MKTVLTRRIVCALTATMGLIATPAGPVSSQQLPVVPGGLVVALPLGTTSGYAPSEVVIAQGTQLQYANADLAHHDVASVDAGPYNGRRFASALVGFGQTSAVAGTETLPPGTYTFICTLHPSMEGNLHVVGPPANARPSHASSSEASDGEFHAPAAHGPVGLGESIAYEQPDSGAEVRVLVESAETAVAGPASIGSSGTVVVPDETDLAAAGIDPHDVFDIRLQASDAGGVVAQVPLRLKRLEAEHADVIFGDVTVTPAQDTFGGGSALDINGPATLSLGTVDLTEVSSIALRAGSPNGLCHPSYEGGFAEYCRAGRAVVTSGTPTGPVVTTIDIRGTDASRPWIRSLSEPLRHHPDGPVDLFVTFLPVAPGDGPLRVRVNYLELNGSGIAEPHALPSDPPGTITLFDGSSLDGWEMAGTGSFSIEPDGSMRSFAGYGLLWYAAQSFADSTLRLEFKVSDPDANSGVFVRFADPDGSALDPSSTGYEVQVQDYGQAYFGTADTSQTGAIYSLAAADRINTRTVGDWNTLEITTIGHSYTVAINGRVVNTFTGDRRLEGFVGVQNHDPTGTVWYRDIRVIPA